MIKIIIITGNHHSETNKVGLILYQTKTRASLNFYKPMPEAFLQDGSDLTLAAITLSMKNILVSTDFSKNAFSAAVFGAELARSSGGRLILFHAYHPAVLLEEAYIWANSDKLEEEVQKKMDELAQTLHQIYGISITRLLKPGFAVDEILFIVNKINPDLLVLGTEGAGIRNSEHIGKITAEVLKKTEQPMVCIPPEVSFEAFIQMALLDNSQVPLGNTAGLRLFQNYVAARTSSASSENKISSDPELETPGLATA